MSTTQHTKKSQQSQPTQSQVTRLTPPGPAGDLAGQATGATDATRSRLTGAVARGTSRLVDLRDRRRDVTHPARAAGTSGTFDSLRQAYAERLDLLRRHASLPELEANAAELAELEQQVRTQAARRHWRDPATYLG